MLTPYLVGCASIGGLHQVVLVKSNPPGAEIYQDDKKLGVTPAYVKVRRERHVELTLRYQGEPEQTTGLTTHYRWRDSFATNCFEFIFAPVGWAVDYVTGASWRMDDPKIVTWDVNAPPTPDTVETAALAPPTSSDPDVSEAIGLLLEKRLDGKVQLLPFEKTEPVFSYYGSEQGLTPDQDQKYRLIEELKVDHLFVAQVDPRDDGYIVTGHLENVYDGRTSHPVTMEVTAAEGEVRTDMSEHRFFEHYFHLLPNTVFLNFAAFDAGNTKATVEINNVGYTAQTLPNQDFIGKSLSYISSLSLGHLERPHKNVRAHWVYSFVPSATVSENRFEFSNYAPLSNTTFDRFYASAGYGGEVGHLSRYGYFYFDFIPVLAWTDLKYQGPNSSGDFADTSVDVVLEIGYTYFVTPHLVVKLFSRTFNEQSSLWRRAIESAMDSDRNVSSASSNFAGVALGYYIPGTMKSANGWKVTEKN